MANGVEMLVGALLKATGLNVDEIKKDALSRVDNFEHSVAILNARLGAIETNLKAICEFHSVAYTPPAEVLPPKSEAA